MNGKPSRRSGGRESFSPATLLVVARPLLGEKDSRPLSLAAYLIAAVVVALHCASARAAPPITAAALAPDGTHVVVGSQAGIEVFARPKLDSPRRIKTSLAHVHDLAFSPDGKRLAAAGGAPAEDGGYEVFSWPGGERVSRSVFLDDVAYQIAWLEDGKLTLAAAEGNVIVCDPAGRKTTRLKGHSRSVLALAALGDGKHLVSAGVDQNVRVWNIESGDLVRTLGNHTAEVRDVALRPAHDGLPMIATAGADRTVRFWQPTIGRMVRFARLASAPLAVDWTPDGNLVLAACEDGCLRAIDPETAQLVHEARCLSGWAYSIAVAADGHAFVGGEGGQMKRVVIPLPDRP